MLRQARLTATLALAITTSGALAQPAKPAEPQEPKSAEATAIIVQPTQTPSKYATAEELLTALESAGRDLRILQSKLRRYRFFPAIEGGGQQQWDGRLIYDTSTTKPGAAPERRFQIDFDSNIRDGNIKNSNKTSWIFDGEWLTEIDYAAKQMHKRQIMPPGQRIDPLALGEGAFPLPIGQQKDKILERFDVVLLAPDDFKHFQNGVFPETFRDTYQLKLTPKPGRDEGRRMTEARLWYRKSDLLPRFAWTSEPDGSTNEYILYAIETNKPLPTDAFDTAGKPGWTVQVSEYKADARDDADPASKPAPVQPVSAQPPQATPAGSAKPQNPAKP